MERGGFYKELFGNTLEIKEYIEARGGVVELAEEEKAVLVEMSKKDLAKASLQKFKNSGVKPPIDVVDLKRAVRDLKKYSKGGKIAIPVMAWLIRKYAGLPEKIPSKPHLPVWG